MSNRIFNVSIYSDGSARNNPDGPGGYGTIVRYTDPTGKVFEKKLSKGYKRTTNNRMELLGCIVGFELLNRPCKVKVYSDSKYLTEAFNAKWIDNWIKNNWKRKKEPVKNVDLWKRLLKAIEPHEYEFIWIKGHNGHPENELCDKMAVEAALGEDATEENMEVF